MKVVHLSLARISLIIKPSPSAWKKIRWFRYKNLVTILYKFINFGSVDDVPPTLFLLTSFSRAMPYDPSPDALYLSVFDDIYEKFPGYKTTDAAYPVLGWIQVEHLLGLLVRKINST
jgi:hypothetical protein